MTTNHCVCGGVSCDGSCCDCPECRPSAWSFCPNCGCCDMAVDVVGCTCECHAPACYCQGAMVCNLHRAEQIADAQQEALTDDTCYCDDEDMCPPCARYLAMVEFVVDTTPSVKLTPEQQAAFDNLPW